MDGDKPLVLVLEPISISTLPLAAKTNLWSSIRAVDPAQHHIVTVVGCALGTGGGRLESVAAVSAAKRHGLSLNPRLSPLLIRVLDQPHLDSFFNVRPVEEQEWRWWWCWFWWP